MPQETRVQRGRERNLSFMHLIHLASNLLLCQAFLAALVIRKVESLNGQITERAAGTDAARHGTHHIQTNELNELNGVDCGAVAGQCSKLYQNKSNLLRTYYTAWCLLLERQEYQANGMVRSGAGWCSQPWLLTAPCRLQLYDECASRNSCDTCACACA